MATFISFTFFSACLCLNHTERSCCFILANCSFRSCSRQMAVIKSEAVYVCSIVVVVGKFENDNEWRRLLSGDGVEGKTPGRNLEPLSSDSRCRACCPFVNKQWSAQVNGI